MVRRHELTDAKWRKIEPLLPANGRPGGQWSDHRTVVNGVLFRARTNVPWSVWCTCVDTAGLWQVDLRRRRRSVL
jgi:transposase